MCLSIGLLVYLSIYLCIYLSIYLSIYISIYISRNLDLSHNRLEKLENKTHGLLEDLLSIRKAERDTSLNLNNIYFKLRFLLVNTINTYQRFKFNILWWGMLSLKCVSNKFAIPNLSFLFFVYHKSSFQI